MPTEIFGQQGDVRDIRVIKASAAKMVFSVGSEELSIVARNATMNVSRNVAPLRSLDGAYYLVEQPKGFGTLSITSVFGPTTRIDKFIEKFQDICQLPENVLSLVYQGHVECAPNVTNVSRHVLRGVLMTTYGASVGGDDMMLVQTMNFLFYTLSIGS